MRHKLCWMVIAVVLVSCGHKSALTPEMGEQPPRLENLHYELTGPALKLEFVLRGDSAGVGYQIDRAEIDPICKCPTMWQRYFEQPPYPSQVGERQTRLLNLRTLDRTYLFRIRAFDAHGRLGAWSKPIRAQAVDLLKEHP